MTKRFRYELKNDKCILHDDKEGTFYPIEDSENNVVLLVARLNELCRPTINIKEKYQPMITVRDYVIEDQTTVYKLEEVSDLLNEYANALEKAQNENEKLKKTIQIIKNEIRQTEKDIKKGDE